MSRPPWPKVKLGEVLKVQNGYAFDGSGFSTDTGTPLIRIRDLKTNQPSLHYVGPVDPSFLVAPDDLLVGMDGEFVCYRWRGPRALLNQRVCRLHENREKIDKAFLHLVINDHLKAIEDSTAYTTVKHISARQIREIVLPLPPLAEQRRIAARLTAQMEQVAAARAAAQARLAAARSLPSALLHEAFGGLGTETRRLGDLLLGIEAGKSLRCSERPAAEGEWGVLKVSAVSWHEFRGHENKVLPPGHVPEPHHEVREGDLLLSRSNTSELVGAVVRVSSPRPRLALSDKTLRLLVDESKVLPGFLEVALRTPGARTFIETQATGSSYSMRNLSQDKIRGIPVPWLPINRQAEVLERMSQQSAILRDCERYLARLLQLSNHLPAALLREAFDG